MGTLQHHEVGRSPIRPPQPSTRQPRPPNRPKSQPASDRLAVHMIDHLTTFARQEAEIVMLELDAIGATGCDRNLRQLLTCRCASMLHLWSSTMAVHGCEDAWWVQQAAKQAAAAFWQRIRELRAAAAPGGNT